MSDETCGSEKVDRGRRWVLALAGVVALYCGLVVSDPVWWLRLGVYHLDPVFLDHYSLTTALDWLRAGNDPSVPYALDPRGRAFVYPPWWLLLEVTGLGTADTVWSGVALCTVALTAALGLLQPRRLGECAMAALVLLSPPVVLSFNRGNNDLFLYVFLVGAIPLLSSASAIRGGIGSALVFLCTGLKYYPVAGFAVLLERYRSPKKLIGMAALVLVALAVFVTTHWRSFQVASRHVPQLDNVISFGGRLLFVNAGFSRPVATVLSLACLGVFLFVVFRWPDRHQWSAAVLEAPAWCRVSFVVGTSIIAFLYFSTSSFEYRYLYVTLQLPLFFWLWRSGKVPAGHRWILHSWLTVLLVVLWLGLPLIWILCGWRSLGTKEADGSAVAVFTLARFLLAWWVVLVPVGIWLCVVEVRLSDLWRQWRGRHLGSEGVVS